jgi:hypothetical protein
MQCFGALAVSYGRFFINAINCNFFYFSYWYYNSLIEQIYVKLILFETKNWLTTGKQYSRAGLEPHKDDTCTTLALSNICRFIFSLILFCWYVFLSLYLKELDAHLIFFTHILSQIYTALFHYQFYVPQHYILSLIFPCTFSQFPWFFLWAGYYFSKSP